MTPLFTKNSFVKKNCFVLKNRCPSLITGSNGVLAVSLPTLEKQKYPVSVIIAATIITLSLVKFSRTPKVKEFFARKATQKMTTISESVKAFRFKRKTNRVGIQNTPEPEEISSEF